MDTADIRDAADPPPGAPAAPRPVQGQAADGAIRPLDPRRVALERTVNIIFGAVVASGHLLTAGVLWLTRGAHADTVLITLAWVPMAALLAWLAFRWPQINYRHWRYRLDADGIEIWSGVAWRQSVRVPRSRVQHIDVSQGPLERSYGLATLSVFTAGTDYSKVDLPGLDHAVALAVRDALLPKGAERAV